MAKTKIIISNEFLPRSDEKELEELIRKSQEGFKCPNTDCCSYLEFQQCNNHSHILCSNYEAWNNAERYNKI